MSGFLHKINDWILRGSPSWEEEINVSVKSYTSHHIDVVVTSRENINWRLTSVYGWPNKEEKRLTWGLMERL